MKKKEFKKLLNEIMYVDDKVLQIERDNDGWCKAIVYDGYFVYVYTAKDKNTIFRSLASTTGVVSKLAYYFDDEGTWIHTEVLL